MGNPVVTVVRPRVAKLQFLPRFGERRYGLITGASPVQRFQQAGAA